MSRSGYVEDCGDYDESQWQLIMYRGAVASAIRGQRGQQILIDLVRALDAMPERRLARRTFNTECGACALGAVAQQRGVDLSDLEPPKERVMRGEEVDQVNTVELAKRLDIAESMAKEVMWENDDNFDDSPLGQYDRWSHMRTWALNNMSEETREKWEAEQ